MPRANRHFLPDHVWHLTHRCHKSSFLLKFSIDRSTWVRWLFEAKKRYGLEVLNYAITSNHIHLLIYGGNDREVIPKSVQLVAGRTAQAYNRRKKRNGAFWEDRYHATAIDTEEHLIRCLLYIDLNMVRAGVVNHPGKWRHCGYHELMNPPKRYRIIARERLRELLGMNENFNDIYEEWIQKAIAAGSVRQAFWSKSVAVGSRDYVSRVKGSLGLQGSGRDVCSLKTENLYILKDPDESYNNVSRPENALLRHKNSLLWEVCPD